ncbi:MAG: hypothetical protein A2Y17_10490 [Clostridiales bacterium GWF2_38_85]|nr:MAG: hypothetical protein A2Y17_10490 [Clostridiales bacterium GWF2_38_85]
MNMIYRILGKRGRITIPHEIQINKGFRKNDILCFVETSEAVIITRGKVCIGSNNSGMRKCEELQNKKLSLSEFVGSLSDIEQKEALVQLSMAVAKRGESSK